MSDEGNRTEKGIAPAPTFPADDAAMADTLAPAPTASASASLPMLDRKRYKVQGEVGRGGLGRILRARDEVLGRPVAVKELLAPDEGAQARFVREALITARLQHPAIVPIYDAGQAGDDGPFYAMKLVAGRSLHEELADLGTFEQRIAYLPAVIAVVDAMAYAHDEKIIHRDLKPQNVLVGKYGETVLIDWGLAKDLSATEAPQRGPFRATSAAGETLDGAVMGTPAFMPPEQAAGDDVDERADVYALGAMLYFVITGAPPHTGRTIDELLLKSVVGDVIPVQEREPQCPADLAAIVAKAMMKELAQRYRDAGALAEDLKRFQTGQLVGAHEYTLGERVRRWLRRHKAIVAVSAIAATILLTYGVWSLVQIRAEREQARRAAAVAEQQRDRAVAQAMLVRARQYAASGHTAEEIAMLRALARPDADAESRRLAIEEGGLIWKAHQRLAMALGHHVGLAYRSADGTRFVATEPGAVIAWDVASGKEVARLAMPGDEAARFGKVLAVSPAGSYVLVTACDGACGIALGDRTILPGPQTRLELRELASGHVVEQWPGGEPVDMRALAFSAGDRTIAVRRADRVTVRSGGTTREVAVGACTGALAVSPAGELAIACADHVLLVKPDGARTEILRAKESAQLAFVAPDRLVAIGDRLALWDVARGELRGEGELPKADDADDAELEDVAWDYIAPSKPAANRTYSELPRIEIGNATYIVPRTSVLAPPPRAVSNGAVVAVEGPQWQTLLVADDLARFALVEALVPPPPPGRCLPRVGGERHATTVLDNGERLLVDEQEVPLGLAIAPPEGYRHTTTAEAPVRQLRPLLAAEGGACLVWGAAVGAHVLDGGVIPALAGIAQAPSGGIVVVGARSAFRIVPDGTRTAIAASESPVISPHATHVASFDPATATLTISDAATGNVVRTWTAPAGVELSRTIQWAASDVVRIRAQLVPVDPALPVRTDELVLEPASPYGLRVTASDVAIVRVADGKVAAKHALAADTSAKLLPDASGRIVYRAAKQYVVVGLDGKQVTLAGDRYVESFEVAATAIIGRDARGIVAWDAATGAALPLADATHAAVVVDDETWSITGHRKPALVRKRRDGTLVRELALSTAGLAFHHAAGELAVSPDRKRIAARYAVSETAFAYAVWDADTGVLLWVGPPTASVMGDWIVAGGRAYRPAFDLPAVLRDSGARTNLRVCEDDLRVVAVVPPPPPDTYWAPNHACR